MNRIIIDCMSGRRQTALCRDEELIEFIPREDESIQSVGNIYVGRVEKILPSKFAFVNIGADKNAFLQLSDKKQESLYEYDEKSGKSRLKIKQGDNIIVQLEKEGSELKGAAVSVNLSFTGKYVVLIANQKGIGISKKIENNDIKLRLKKAAKEVLPEGYALIMRTNCQNAEAVEIKEEISFLYKKSLEIIEKGKYIKPPYLLYKAENETDKIIRDYIINDDDEIIVNEKSVYDELLSGEYKSNVRLYEGAADIFQQYGVQTRLEKALHSKVWLKSGGFIIIDEAEACTVIDVNSGKFIGADRHKTTLKTNLEAAEETAKQLRLRNLSGMIIIDFIDMAEPEDRQAVTDRLRSLVKKDRINTTIVSMTELGLMQLTRKKTRVSLLKALTVPCPCCSGTGRIENDSFIADRIRKRVCSIFADTIYNLVTISSNKRVIDAFKGKNNEYKLIEEKYGKLIRFNIISTQKSDYFEIEKEKIN